MRQSLRFLRASVPLASRTVLFAAPLPAQSAFNKTIVTQDSAKKAVAGPQARDDSPQDVERDPQARASLGTLYAAGAGGLRKDPLQAFLWLEMAAAHRDALNLKPAEQGRMRSQIGASATLTVR